MAYNDAYYSCQIGGNSWSCFMWAQNQLNTCLWSCPAECSSAELIACQDWCYTLPYPGDTSTCLTYCMQDYC